MHKDWKKAQDVLKHGGVAFVPTDTIYGILASAFNKDAVERVYKIRGRDKDKPCIVLISSLSDLKKFSIKLDKSQNDFLSKVWPGKVSVILPCTLEKLKYLHRGKKSIAFRMIGPRNKNLFNILKLVGPVIAPSANPQGLLPATKRSEGRKYFGDSIDAYICVGTKISKPSTLVEYRNGKLKILREGAVKIKKDKL